MAADAPRVSVITPVHNGEDFLAEAIASILAQTWGDYEYLLVNDASTDRSPAILKEFAAEDHRLTVIDTASGIGQSKALNTALKIAQGEFVAILDADDLAYPERLHRQVCYLEAHPEVGVVGAQVQQIDSTGCATGTLAFPQSCAMARWGILWGTPVLHSAAMVRRSLLQQIGGYDVRWQYAADYSLWVELSGRTGITNLPETLVAYRRHEQQMSMTRNITQQGEVWLLIYRMLAERLSLRVPLNTIGELFRGVRGAPLADAAALDRAAQLLAQVYARYLLVECPDPATVAQIDASCARRLLRMAWVQRRRDRAASRTLLQRALEFDPLLWQRPQTRAFLRHLHQQPRRDSED